MNMKKKESIETPEATSENKIGRRDFLKTGTIGAAGAAIGAGSVLLNRKKLSAEVAKSNSIKVHKDFPVELKPDFKRFRQKNTVFSRAAWDPKIIPRVQKFAAFKAHKEEGWTALDRALSLAGWSVEDHFGTTSKFGTPNTQAYNWDGPVRKEKHNFKDALDATKKVKKAAKFLGASLVGISKFNPLWVYDPLFVLPKNKEIPAKFPFKPKSVIVMAIEMDYKTIGTSPSFISDAAVGLAYSQMAELGNSVTTFLRELGHKAFGAGNDVALSIPYAIEAGLGECGRNGILVTYEYGPRVRLCKVFTELELVPDNPKTFGVQDFCRVCGRCAENCPSKAISFDKDPSFKGPSLSNNNGALKWYVDADKCIKQWADNDCACANCIASCPYNKPDFWHHKMITGMTTMPGSALHSTMVQMDKIFGFGNTYDKDANEKWWNED